MNGRRSLWWTVHHWLGLKLSLLLTVILLTGTLATVSNEIDWLIFPAARTTPQDAPHASWGRWAEGVRSWDPKAEVLSVHAPLDPWWTAGGLVIDRAGQPVFVRVDPWTARVTGTMPWGTAQRFFRDTHRHLMLGEQWGIFVVSAFSFLLLGSAVTGLVVYKKFWRGFLSPPRWRRGRPGELRRWLGALHRFVAVWSVWFLLLTGLTGVWYFAEQSGLAAAPLPQPAVQTAGADPDGARLDAVVAAARRAYPDLRVRSLSFPFEGDPGVRIEGQARAILVRDRANTVFVDPFTLRPLGVVRGEQLDAHQRVSEAADPLHFGTWGGLASKLAWFVFGCGLTTLSISGTAVYATRLKAAEAPTRRRSALRRLWDGMGPFAYVAVAVLLLWAVFLPRGMSWTG